MRRSTTIALTLVLAGSVLMTTGGTASANPIAGNGYSSSYAGESVFESKAAGESGQFSVIFFNDGIQPWTAGVVGLLVCLSDKTTCNVASPNASYAQGWYSTTVYSTVSATTSPGQNGFFIWNFKVPAGTAGGTATTFNGDVGLIATGTMLRPEGYYQVNTTPQATGTLTISPTSTSVAVAGQQQFTATTNLTGTVSWTVVGGCGGVTSAGLFVATATTSSGQPCSVKASIGSLTAEAPVTVFGAASQITCSANPTTLMAGGSTTSTLTFTVKDANGNTVTTGTPAVNVTNATPTLATLSASGALAATNGVLTVTVTPTTVTGDIVVSASGSNLTSCSVLITSAAAGAATKTAASFVDNPIAADGVSTTKLQVDVQDANGARVVGDSSTVIDVSRDTGSNVCTVTGVATGTGGTAGAGSGSATTVQGRVEFTITSTTVPGGCRLTATPRTSGIASSSATLTTQIVGQPTQLGVVSNNSPHPAGSSSLTKVKVAVKDALGSRVTSSSLAITAALDSNTCASAGGGNVVISVSPATSGGQAEFEFTSNGAYSACLVSFTASGITGASATIVFTPGSADHLGCTFSPSTITANGSSTSVALVRLKDQSGNDISVGSYSVQLARSSGSYTTLVTANPQTMSNGLATFTVQSTTTIGTDTYTPSLYTGTLPTVVSNTTCTIVTQ